MTAHSYRPPCPALRPLRVLYTTDDAHDHAEFSEALADKGCNASVDYATGAATLEALGSGSYDAWLVCLRVGFPSLKLAPPINPEARLAQDMQAIDLLRARRDRGIAVGTILGVWGGAHETTETVLQLAALGAQVCICKPQSAERYAQAIPILCEIMRREQEQ